MKTKNLILLLISLLIFLLAVIVINAEGCCVRTNGNQYCVSEKDGALQSNCEKGLWFSESCDKIPECGDKGCCYIDNGCNDEVLKLKCQNNQGKPSKSKCSETEECKRICCKVDLGYLYVKQSECDKLSGSAEDKDEFDCKALNYGIDGERVCCVKDDGSCIRLTSDKCDGTPYKGFLCKDAPCNPKCETKTKIDRGDLKIPEEAGKLFWYDSCGNPEEIVKESDSIEDFKKLGYDKSFDGDCGKDPSKVMGFKKDGLITCADLVCNKLWDNPYTDENHNGKLNDDSFFEFGGAKRDFRYNGESWCEYMQAKVGPGLDLPGTRHYRHYCDSGFEKVDVKDNGREDICVEKVVNGMTKAEWIFNDAGVCLECNDQDIVNAGNSKVCCEQARNQKVPCTYIERKAIYKDKIALLFFKEVFDQLIKMNEEVNSYDVKYKKLKYLKDGKTVREENFDSVIEGLNDPMCKDVKVGWRDASNNTALCSLFLRNPSRGTYELVVSGKGCVKLTGICSNNIDISLGVFDLGPISNEVCLPLVPPSGKEFCKSFSKYGFDKTTPYVSHNYYYNTPYNGFGLGKECDGTEECLKLYIANVLKYGYTIPATSVDYSADASNMPRDTNLGIPRFIYDDINSLCKGFGDCGYSSDLLGNFNTMTKFDNEPNSICYAVSNNDKACYVLIDSDYGNISSAKYSNLKKGKVVTPNNFIPEGVFFFLPFSLFKKKKLFSKKQLIYFLLILSIILAGCEGSYEINYPVPPNSYLKCGEWFPSSGATECWRCNEKMSKGGLLPDVDLNDSTGKPYYKCTKELCYSLGIDTQQCIFQQNDKGSYCAPVTNFQVPTIEFLNAKFICSSNEPGDCSDKNFKIGDQPSGASIEILGKLESGMLLEVKFKTKGDIKIKDSNSVKQDIATMCYSSKTRETEKGVLKNNQPIDLGIEHIIKIPLVPKPDSQNVFIQCDNLAPKTEHSNPAEIKFTVAKQEDVGSPGITKITPKDGNNFVPFDKSSKEVSLYVRGNPIQCGWANESIQFKDMKNLFFCSKSANFEYGGSKCDAVVKDVKLGSNNYWFSCKNSKGLNSDPSPPDGINIIGTNQLNITNIKCEHSLGENCDKIYDSSFGFSIKTIGGAEDGKAKCRWAVDDYDYDVFSDPGGDLIAGKGKNIIMEPKYSNSHKKINYEHKTGIITLKFLCSDIAGNIAQSNVTINIDRDLTAPKILKTYRYGNELFVNTNEISKCYYSSNSTFNLNNKFNTKDGLEHNVGIEGNFYKVRCEDNFNNTKDIDVYITKLR